MVNVILNGGFNDDPNKKALIRYMTNIGALHSSVIPLVFGVDKGKDFFFSNLVDSVKILNEDLHRNGFQIKTV